MPDDEQQSSQRLEATEAVVRETGLPQSFTARAADKRATSVGVYTADGRAYLVKLQAQQGKLPAIVDADILALPGNDVDAAERLRQSLSKMVGKGVDLWTSMQSPQTVIQTIRVPRVPDRDLARVAFWTLRKERNLSIEDTVFDVERLREVRDSGRSVLELQVVAAPESELKECAKLYQTLGFDLAGVTCSVFSFRNLLRFAWPEHIQRQCVVLFINETSSDILIFSGGIPLATRTLRAGLAGIREAICQQLDIDESDPRLLQALSVLRGTEQQFDIGTGETADIETVLKWIRPALRRLLRNIEMTLQAFEGQLGPETAVKFFVAGSVAEYAPVHEFISQQLGVRLEIASLANSSTLRDTLLSSPPGAKPNDTGLSMALGLALAGVYDTANLLCTFADRHKLQQQEWRLRICRLTAFTILACLICAVAITRFHVLMQQRERDQRARARSGEMVAIDREDVEETLRKATVRQGSIRRMAGAYRAPAIVAEISNLTPPAIRIIEMRIAFREERGRKGAPPSGITDLKQTTAARKAADSLRGLTEEGTVDHAGEITVQGIIAGNMEYVEAELTRYVLALQRSAFLLQPVVVNRKPELTSPAYLKFGAAGSDVLLHFTVNMKIKQG